MSVEGLINEFTEKLKRMRDEQEAAKVRIGIIGASGDGKSSLINAIVGRQVASVGDVEMTDAPQEVEHAGVTFVDLPGCNTERWPRETYINDLQLKGMPRYDAFLIVLRRSVTQDAVMLYNELQRKAKTPCFIVRTYFDEPVRNRHGDEATARSEISAYLRKSFGLPETEPVYLVSNISEMRYDLDSLVADIVRSLPDAQRLRFIESVQILSEEGLRLRRDAMHKVVGVYCGLAAANAFNPVPGFDVAVDLGTLVDLTRRVVSAYGLDRANLEFYQQQWPTISVAVLTRLVNQFAPRLTTAGLTSVLKRYAGRVAAKQAAKWAPLVGQVVAASIGAALTYKYGDDLIDECEAAARELMEAVAAAQTRTRVTPEAAEA